MSMIFKFHRRTSKGSGTASWAYELNGGTNINITLSQLTSWGMPSTATDITITNTGTIKSSSSTIPAITVANITGKTIKLVNNASCYIIGKGGNGATNTNQPGSSGGHAVSTSMPLTIDNLGIIGGGGGGGGAWICGGGGGGGYGIGGTGFTGGATNGTNGTKTNGGDSGSYSTVSKSYGTAPGVNAQNPSTFNGTGGAGGGLGANGGSAVDYSNRNNLGGSAGKAININGQTITWVNTGTRYGSIT